MTEKPIRQATFVMSDCHLSEGSVFPNGKPNRLEDFPAENDRMYVRMLEARLKRHGRETPFRHSLNGDMVDFMAIRHDGKFGIEPTEGAAVEQLKTCLRGHPGFFGGLRRLAEKWPNLEFDVCPGNHDIHFWWPAVQRTLTESLVPKGQERRVRFYEELRLGDAAVRHGAEHDPPNANPTEDKRFINDKVGSRRLLPVAAVIALATTGTLLSVMFRRVDWTAGNVALACASFASWWLMLGWLGRKLYFKFWAHEERLLNIQYSSYLNAGLGMQLKRWFFPDIGRREDHGDIWWQALARRPFLFFLIVPIVIVHALYQKVFHPILSQGGKATWRMLVHLIVNTTRPDQIEEQLVRFLRERPEIRHYVFGHTHRPGVATRDIDGRTVATYNPGTGIKQQRMIKPAVKCVTRHSAIETFFRRIGYHWRHAPGRAILSTLAYLSVPAAAFAVSLWRGWPIGPVQYGLAAGAVYLLAWWQSAAEYRDETFTEFTPAEILEYEDGTISVRLLRYVPETNEFKDFLTGEIV